MAVGLQFKDGDFIISDSGSLEIVEQEEKCLRDFGKMLVTDREFGIIDDKFDRYNPTYGTELNNHDIFRGLSKLEKRDMIVQLLNEAISDYIKLQESRDNLDFGEVITGVDFDVFFNPEDEREILIDIKIRTALNNTYINVGTFVQTFQ